MCFYKKKNNAHRKTTNTLNNIIKQQRGRQNGQQWSEHTGDNKHLDIIWYGDEVEYK